MAKLNIPKDNTSRTKRKKGAVPTLEEASSNMGEPKEVIKFMSFKVPESFNRDFKQLALDHDISLTELLKRSFYHYKEHHK